MFLTGKEVDQASPQAFSRFSLEAMVCGPKKQQLDVL
jgi:hypothetical protein